MEFDASTVIPVKSQDEVSPISENDYIGDDGMAHCSVCGKAKQVKIRIPGSNKEMVVPCICKCRERELEEERERKKHDEEMRRIERLRDSSMMASKFRKAKFSSYRIRDENKDAHRIASNYVKHFRDMYNRNQGLIFYGPVGTGKSYTAACIANALIENRTSVIMTSFVKILQDIDGRKMGEAEYMAILNSASLLIIDDLGAERSTEYAQEKVYNIIDSRARSNKPMILTTNLDINDMMDTSDIQYKRIYDRIFEGCFPVEITGESFRIQEAADRFDEMAQLLK